MIAFLGKPSKTDALDLAVGWAPPCHQHLLYKGTTGAATPYHVAAQPTVWKDDQGKTHDPLGPDAGHRCTACLSRSRPSRRNRRSSTPRFNDVYVGPGKDGKVPRQK